MNLALKYALLNFKIWCCEKYLKSRVYFQKRKGKYSLKQPSKKDSTELKSKILLRVFIQPCAPPCLTLIFFWSYRVGFFWERFQVHHEAHHYDFLIFASYEEKYSKFSEIRCNTIVFDDITARRTRTNSSPAHKIVHLNPANQNNPTAYDNNQESDNPF